MSLKMVLSLPNNTDPDEMQHCAAFHQGLHCLPNHPFRGLQKKQRVNSQLVLK